MATRRAVDEPGRSAGPATPGGSESAQPMESAEGVAAPRLGNLARLAPAQRASAFAALQRTIGNRSVQRLVAGADAPSLPAIPPNGAPLPDDEQQRFGAALGETNLKSVRVHDGAEAREAAAEIGTTAFTRGDDVVLGAGADGSSRDHILGHELTHVVQQREGRVPAIAPESAVTAAGDALEQEATVAGAQTGAPAPHGATAPGSAVTTATPSGATPSGDVASGAAASSPASRGSITTGGPQVPEDVLAPLPPPGQGPPEQRLGADPSSPPVQPPRQAAPPVIVAAPAAVGPAAPVISPTPSATAPAPPPVAAVESAAPAPAAAPESPATIAPPRLDGPGAAAGARVQARGEALAGLIEEARDRTLGTLRTTAAAARAAAEVSATNAIAEAEQRFRTEEVRAHARAGEATDAIAAGRSREREALAATRAEQTARHNAGVIAARTGAAAHTTSLQEQASGAGDTQVDRVAAGSEQRAQAAREAGARAQASGNPDARAAASDGGRRMGDKSAQEIAHGGAQLGAQVRQEATHHAQANLGQAGAEFDAHITQTGTEVAGHLAAGGASAVAKIDALGAASEAAVSHAGAESAAALARERANAVAHLRQWQQESLDDLARTEQDAAARVTADFEEARIALLEQAARAAETVASAEESAADGRADAVIGELDAALESALGALQERDATIIEAFDGAGSKLRGQATEIAHKLGDAAASAGGEVQAKLAGAERHGTADLERAGATARGTLVAAVDDASAKTKEADANYRDRLTAMHAPAAQALGQLASDGLASQDQLVAKTGSEAQSAGQRIEARSSELTEEAHRRSDSEQGNARTQAFLGFIGDWLSNLSDSIKSWLKNTFGEFWGGLIFGILAGLVMVAIGAAAIYVIGAMIGSAIAAVAVAGWVLAVVAVGAAVGFGIANRFAEFNADTGRDPSIWEGLGLVGLGIADLTGVPFVIEAIVGRRAFSPRDMSPFERGSRLGMGTVFVVAIGSSIVRGVARIGAGRPGVGAGKGPPIADPPGAKPPVVDPPGAKPPAVDPPGAKPPAMDPPAADPVPARPPTIERAALARELGLDAQLAGNLSEALAARLRALLPGLSRDRVGGLRNYVQRALERGRDMDDVVGRLEAMERSELAEFLDGQSGVRWEPNWRGNPHIEDGNAAEGWQHIVARHISGTDPGGDLFAAGTTRSEVQAAAVEIVRRGTRVSQPGRRIQVFEGRTRVHGRTDRVRVTVDAVDGRVITIFPVITGP